MEIIKYPSKAQWASCLTRPLMDHTALFETVRGVLNEIRNEGDAALRRLEEKFDKVVLSSLSVTEEEWNECDCLLSDELKTSIETAAQNIRTFHTAQWPELKKVTTSEGVTCWQKAVPIEKVGLYIPGGTAPLFSSVLMLALPAKIAGCKKIVLCTPPDKNGKVHPAILYAAKTAGVSSIYKLGGIQAIGAMAYGTESVEKVYKIFGPGNQYVMAAKQLVSLHEVAIDMPAGPSEVAVITDSTANPAFVAADLLSQAEHGVDSQAVMITTDEAMIDAVVAEVESQLNLLPRKEIATRALEHSKLIVLRDMEQVVEMVNEYAPEHLIVSAAGYRDIAEQITNAGSIFMGYLTPESAGDYASGTNHTLPTNGYAKAYSGVNLDSFLKKITYQEITPEGLAKIGPVIECMAANEQLFAHKNAVTLRLQNK